MYGRLSAGHSATASSHQPADTTIATPAASSCRMRRQSVVGAAHRYAAARPGTTRKACSIFVRNPKPRNTPASSSQRVDAFSTACVVAHAAATISSTSSASGLLNLNISTATGVSARTAPASSPAAGPATRRTVAQSRATAATAMSACGTSMLHDEKPKIRPDRAITHSEAGGLSTVIALAESSEPKKNAVQLCVPAWTAAA